MSIKFKNITCKNFLSVGNQTQAIDFEKESLTLVLGENLDLGANGSGNRNGVGKTAMVNALSYAIYGQALTNIKKENLINKINGKNMLVTVEFEKDQINYRIERGRRPNVLRLYINDQEQVSKEDEAQGDSRETQKFIDQCLGLSHTMFKNIVALNTYSEPFLAMRTSDQREIIEQLLGITLLSEKAEALKIQIKTVKDQITTEQMLIESIKTANVGVQKSIESLEMRCRAWDKKHQQDIENLATSIAKLEQLDIDQELANHEKLTDWKQKNDQLSQLKKQKAMYESAIPQAKKTVDKYQKQLLLLADKSCPQCQQSLQDHMHTELMTETAQSLEESQTYLQGIEFNLVSVDQQLSKINTVEPAPEVYYDNHSQALNHRNQLANLASGLETKSLSRTNHRINQHCTTTYLLGYC